MTKGSILMSKWSPYTGTTGHDIVIENLCKGLNKLGYETSLGTFTFEKEPPEFIKKVHFRKSISTIPKEENFDIIHNHQTLFNFYSLFSKKPFLFHYHLATNKKQEMLLKMSLTLCRNKIKKIIAVSDPEYEQIKNLTKISTYAIHNGVDTEFFKPNLSKPYVKGTPQLLYVGNLFIYKNIEKIIFAMKKILITYSNAHLQIIGYGEDHERLLTIIKKLNLEKHVELVGKVFRDELRLRYSSCDVYVSASKVEAIELTPLEAMACGKPAVLFDTPTHRKFISESKAGGIFSSEDSQDM
ncbi:MAG: glycosyltransferase family 4 protein, partial [Thaumarchaeota archaeon]|nr:glycosyltransferase family 4 protein [Nitrososphaerota archaeon]